jgi:hypothetical protein
MIVVQRMDGVGIAVFGVLSVITNFLIQQEGTARFKLLQGAIQAALAWPSLWNTMGVFLD